ncbi:hypothetical protein GCM10023353_22140 [Tomitella cavernea]|uniref:ABC transporter domain-containing protein n=1 Tax=Tomitella cavernea TaxID=1387982 RepID=A0ABP9CPI4_9ACTN
MRGRRAGARQADGPNTLERTAGDTPAVRLQLCDVGKVYPGVRALDAVDFDAHGGEVHGLLGENVPGRSTLIKMMAGVDRPDSGELSGFLSLRYRRFRRMEHSARRAVASGRRSAASGTPAVSVATARVWR